MLKLGVQVPEVKESPKFDTAAAAVVAPVPPFEIGIIVEETLKMASVTAFCDITSSIDEPRI